MKTWIITALAQIASMFDPVDPDPQVALVAHLQFYGGLCAMMGYDYQELKSPALDKEFTVVRPDLETQPGTVALRMGRALMQLRLQSQYDCPSSKHLAQVWRGVNGERASSGVGF